MSHLEKYGGFLKLGVPFWGSPRIRTIVFWGLYWGPLISGNYHIGVGAHLFGNPGLQFCPNVVTISFLHVCCKKALCAGCAVIDTQEFLESAGPSRKRGNWECIPLALAAPR